MSISNGYATLDEVKGYMLEDAPSDAQDDVQIERMIEAASRWFDAETDRTFYARTETRKFNVPWSARTLVLDDDLLSITTFTNGDAVTISASAYNLEPINAAPYSLIRLKSGSQVFYKTAGDADREAVISILGSWGYSTTAPADVKQAVIEIVKGMYNRAIGQNEDAVTQITAGGIVVTPQDIPSFAAAVIVKYHRIDLDLP